MTGSLNKVILLGNLTRDPELRHAQSGTAIAKFGMAMNRRRGEGKEETCFVDCSAFGKQAEIIAQYAKKGSKLAVDGRLEYQTWQDNSGAKRNKLEVIVENFTFAGGKEEQQQGPEQHDRDVPF